MLLSAAHWTPPTMGAARSMMRFGVGFIARSSVRGLELPTFWFVATGALSYPSLTKFNKALLSFASYLVRRAAFE